jgi:hypothetical protein
MTDAVATEAARALARQRWGSTRTHRLVDELLERVAEVDEEQAVRLRAALDESRQRRRTGSA